MLLGLTAVLRGKCGSEYEGFLSQLNSAPAAPATEAEVGFFNLLLEVHQWPKGGLILPVIPGFWILDRWSAILQIPLGGGGELVDELLQLCALDVVDLVAEMAGQFRLALSGLDPWSLGKSRWPKSGLTAASVASVTVPEPEELDCQLPLLSKRWN